MPPFAPSSSTHAYHQAGVLCSCQRAELVVLTSTPTQKCISRLEHLWKFVGETLHWLVAGHFSGCVRRTFSFGHALSPHTNHPTVHLFRLNLGSQRFRYDIVLGGIPPPTVFENDTEDMVNFHQYRTTSLHAIYRQDRILRLPSVVEGVNSVKGPRSGTAGKAFSLATFSFLTSAQGFPSPLDPPPPSLIVLEDKYSWCKNDAFRETNSGGAGRPFGVQWR